jgi:hypothetical protein
MTKIGKDAEPADYSPSEAWINEFKRQCTNELRLAMKRYAMRKLFGIGKYGAAVDDDAAAELVQNILGDALLGTRIWEPTKKTLRQHVEDVIHSRAYHMRKHAKKYRHERIDAFDAGAETHAARGELEASIQMDRDEDDLESRTDANRVIDELRELADGDQLVLRFLDAHAAGARTREDIMHVAKMSTRTFRTARDRVRKLVEQLDNRTIAPLRRA